jgi:chemotaxis protein MotB
MAAIVPQRRRKKEQGAGFGVRPTPLYMTTWGDMQNLLLTVFILLLVLTVVYPEREFRLILSAFQGSFGMMTGGMTLSKGKLADMGMTIESLPSTQRGRKLAKAWKKAMQMFKTEIKTEKVRIREDERGLVITLMNDAYFEQGKADLLPQTKEVLIKVAEMLSSPEIQNKVRVEGHTDNTPMKRDTYPHDNWELSAQRAINVVKFLVEQGVEPSRLSAAGYGEYRPLPGNNNATPEERAQNRRTEIILLWEESQL